MFYSHEILTSRKYGVATVWLVATLGSKSTSKRVKKKAILDVDIPKACGVIIEPEAPMALRLQSNLLCGVSRVYLQQCGYALVDAQNIQAQMRQLIRSVQRRDQDLDLEVGRAARPEQLLLPDDPNFLPDLTFDVDLDLANLDFGTEPSSQSASVLSPRSRQSSRTSFGGMPALEIPSSSGAGGGFGLGGFPMGGDLSELGGGRSGQDEVDIPEDALLPEPEFTFDNDGNLFEFDEPIGTVQSPQLAPVMRSRAASEISAQAQRNVEQTPQDPDPNIQAMDLDYDIPEDDGLPAAEPFSPRQRQVQDDEPAIEEEEEEEEAGSTYGAQAPMAREARQAKPLALDKTLEIRNTELLSWNTNYLANMAEVRKKKEVNKAAAQSKKNAEWWVWGAGLGGVGYEVRSMGAIKHPLDMFCGEKLRELLLGSDAVTRKHGRELDEAESDEGRRVRQRSEEYGRGDEDVGDTFAEGMDYDEPPEIGRRAPTPPPGAPSTDASSAMPWNISGPNRSSQIGRRAPTADRHRSLSLQRQRPGSHLTSASPLLGRGAARAFSRSRPGSIIPAAGLPSGAGLSSSVRDGVGGFSPRMSGGAVGDEDYHADDYDELGPGQDQDDFDRFGAAAAVDTQTAGASQWIRRQLDAESGNFLVFAEAAIAERGEDAPTATEEEEAKKGIIFGALLRPEENTHVVAAQGLLHVLTLATKGLMWVKQQEDVFGGDLWIGPTGAVQAGREGVAGAATNGSPNAVEVEAQG